MSDNPSQPAGSSTVATRDNVRETPPDSPHAVPRREPRPHERSVAATLADLLRYPLFPLIWLMRLLVFRVHDREGTQTATFTSFSSVLYAWPIVAVALLGWALESVVQWPLLGWILVITIFVVLLVLGTDISRNNALMTALFIALLLAVGALINKTWQIPVLGTIYNHFHNLGVTWNRGIALGLGELIGIALIVVVIQALADGRHEISSREVTHRRFLRASESWPLNINRVRLDWPDLMEMIVLFGAGHLVIIDQDRREVLRIPNIPCLWFFRDEVNRILDIMATTEVVDPARTSAGKV